MPINNTTLCQPFEYSHSQHALLADITDQQSFKFYSVIIHN